MSLVWLVCGPRQQCFYAYLLFRCISMVSTTVFLYHESCLAWQPGAVPRRWRPSHPPSGNARKHQLHENAGSHARFSIQHLLVETTTRIWLASCSAARAAQLGCPDCRGFVISHPRCFVLQPIFLLGAVCQIPRTRPNPRAVAMGLSLCRGSLPVKCTFGLSCVLSSPFLRLPLTACSDQPSVDAGYERRRRAT